MSGIYIRYKPSITSDEPWRAAEVPVVGERRVDVLELLKANDVFTGAFPITKVLSADPKLTGRPGIAGELNEVRVVSIDNLSSVTSVYIHRRGGASTADHTTIIPGPISGAITTKARTHRLRVYNEGLEAFVATDAITSTGCFTSLMIESVPKTSISPEVTKMFRYTEVVDHQIVYDAHHTSMGYKTEVELQSEWSQSPIPTDRSGFDSGKWKNKIRKGVPNIHRHFVLPSLLERCATGKQSLEEAMKWTYSWPPSPDFVPAHSPTFGAQYVPALPSSIPLQRSGWLYQKFILSCLAQQQPDITVCPMLPAVVGYLLMVLTPNEAFLTASKLMQLSRREMASTIRYLPLSAESSASFVQSAIRIASSTGLAKGNATAEMLTILFEDVGLAFFSQTLPHLYALKVLDMYLFEGIKIVIRIFVGILRVYLPKLGNRDLTQFLVGGPSVENSLFNTCTQSSFDHIVEEGFKLSLSKADIKWSGASPSGSSSGLKREVHHWPIMSQGAAASRILGTNLTWYEQLYYLLPTTYSTNKRVFRASEEGWSLANFYTKVESQKLSNAFIVVQTDSGMRVGLFTTEMHWRVGKAYVGSRNDFIFSITVDGVFTSYSCSNCKKENTLLCEREFITVGEGPAFRLTGDLQSATSSACPVFASPALWKDTANVVELEVFHIE